MDILVTGAKGFVGRNLVENLKNVRDHKNRTRKFTVDRIFEFDLDTDPALLEDYCRKADFVFHLAGVNRPKNNEDFMQGNYGFTSDLLDTLRKYGNMAPVMLSSSIQASLSGRFAGSEYGRSKLAGEELLFSYGRETGVKVLVYRFPNLFGKWSKPDYNSAIATFCNAVANDLPFTVNDRSTELELLYIDDLIGEMFDALEGKEHHCEYDEKGIVFTPDGRYCAVPVTHRATLGEIVDLLESFKEMPDTLVMPSIPEGSFAKKLFSMYLSYLPKEKGIYPLKMNIDYRGNFTEIIRTSDAGQVSINIAPPGMVRGQHWHNSKWEIFVVVSGHGLIQQRKIGTDENGERYPVREYEVSGDKMEAIQILPGFTHNIINLSDTENLVTVMWANEPFDPNHPDTFTEIVAE